MEQCIATDINGKEESTVVDDDEEDQGQALMKSKPSFAKVEYQIIAKLRATRPRHEDEPIYESSSLAFDLASNHGLYEESRLTDLSDFYNEQSDGFSTSTSSPDFTPYYFVMKGGNIDNFSLNHSFAS